MDIDGSQCFPRWLYDANDAGGALFGEQQKAEFKRRDAITDEGLAAFEAAYAGEMISKDDLFIRRRGDTWCYASSAARRTRWAAWHWVP
jgi:hypothetical protein